MVSNQTVTKKDKIDRQENWQEPNLLQSLYYSYSRRSNNQVAKAKIGQHIQIGNACISDLNRGTALLGDVSEEAWQIVYSFFNGVKNDGGYQNHHKDLDNLDTSNLSNYFVSRNALIVKDLETLSIEQLRSLLIAIVQGRSLDIQILLGITDINLDCTSKESRLIKEIFYNCWNKVIFNCKPPSAQHISNIFGLRKPSRLFVDSDQISSLPDEYFWFLNGWKLMQNSSPILCKYC